MIKGKHFYLVRGLIREQGHWGHFRSHLQTTFPDALITAIDIPGAGKSYLKASPLTVRAMVEEMRQEYLKQRANDEVSHFVAISLGGMIAVEWMKTYPHDFQEGTLINTSFGGISPLFHRLRPEAFAFLLKVPFLRGRKKESRILDLVCNHKEFFDETLNRWELIQKERPVSLENTLRQLLAAANFHIGNFTPAIPITLLAATHDRMVDVNCSRAIARHWKVRLSEHPTGGHDLSVDDPAWLALKIKEALTSRP